MTWKSIELLLSKWLDWFECSWNSVKVLHFRFHSEIIFYDRIRLKSGNRISLMEWMTFILNMSLAIASVEVCKFRIRLVCSFSHTFTVQWYEYMNKQIFLCVHQIVDGFLFVWWNERFEFGYSYKGIRMILFNIINVARLFFLHTIPTNESRKQNTHINQANKKQGTLFIRLTWDTHQSIWFRIIRVYE